MEGSLASPLEWGLVPYALDEILRQASKSSDRSFLVTVSYVELYREQLYDLLAPPRRGRFAQSNLYARSLVICIGTSFQKRLNLSDAADYTRMLQASCRGHHH